MIAFVNKHLLYEDRGNDWIKGTVIKLPIVGMDGEKCQIAINAVASLISNINSLERLKYLKYDLMSMGRLYDGDSFKRSGDVVGKNYVDINGLNIQRTIVNFNGGEGLTMSLFFEVTESTLELLGVFDEFVRNLLAILLELINMEEKDILFFRGLISSLRLKYICRGILGELDGTIKKDSL